MHKSAKESSSARRMKKLNGKSSWFRKDTTNDETENYFLLEGRMGRQRKGLIKRVIDETIRWKQRKKLRMARVLKVQLTKQFLHDGRRMEPK